MVLVRPTAIAGSFYQEDGSVLQSEIQEFIERANRQATPLAKIPKALIAPHAGHRYSGYCAVRAYLSVPEERRQKITRIILLGPAHFHPGKGMSLTRADLWECPLGAMEIDKIAAKIALQFPQVEENDLPHIGEHCLEVHVPFLRTLFANAKLLPFVVTDTPADKVAEVLQALWGGDETLIIISSDLSHYNSYDDAVILDSQTAAWIESYDWSSIGGEHACGRVPMAGLLSLASAKGMAIERVHMMNSGDAMDDKSAKVVGYGSWALH